MKNSIVTLTYTLELSEILTDGSFMHDHVVDIRRCHDGQVRPIEEEILKRLRNHFISYDQFAIDLDDMSSCEEADLCKMLNQYEGNTLIITDNLPEVAKICTLYDIPFISQIFYVVETGKGDFIKPFLQPQNKMIAPKDIVVFG